MRRGTSYTRSAGQASVPLVLDMSLLCPDHALSACAIRMRIRIHIFGMLCTWVVVTGFIQYVDHNEYLTAMRQAITLKVYYSTWYIQYKTEVGRNQFGAKSIKLYA